MGKAWMWSSLVGGVAAGVLLAASLSSHVTIRLPGGSVYWLPVVALLSGLLGNWGQRAWLTQTLHRSLPGWLHHNLAWVITHSLTWTVMVVGVTFVTVLSSMVYQRSSLISSNFLLACGVLGTGVGLVAGGMQLLFWRAHLQPQLLWLGLNWGSWVLSAILLAMAILLPYWLESQGWVHPVIAYLLTAIGIALAWAAQALAGTMLLTAVTQ